MLVTGSILALLLAASNASKDWVEIPVTSPVRDLYIYAQLNNTRTQDGKILVPTISVARTSYWAASLTVDCAARTISFPAVNHRLRHNNAENGTVIASTSSFESADTFRPVGEAVCGLNPSTVAGYFVTSGDPKAKAWKRIDDYIETLPTVLKQTLASAAPHLKLRVGGKETAVSSGSTDGCAFKFQLADGRTANLHLSAHDSYLLKREIRFDQVIVKGFTEDEMRKMDLALQWTRPCNP